MSHSTIPNIRWMIRSDLNFVMAIENEVFRSPWTRAEMRRVVRTPNVIAVVAESPVNLEGLEVISGFMVYALERDCLELWNIAVAPNFQRCGVGAAFHGWLADRLSPCRALSARRSIRLLVRETNFAAISFFRAMGYRATGLIRNAYTADDCDEDAYQMTYSLDQPADRPADRRGNPLTQNRFAGIYVDTDGGPDA